MLTTAYQADRLGRFRVLGCGCIIPLQFDVVLERAQHFVGPDDDFIPCFEATGDFDVRGAGDAGGDRNKLRFQLAAMRPQHEDPLGARILGASGAPSPVDAALTVCIEALPFRDAAVRMAKAWMGIANTFCRRAVVIFAVAESPGRSSGGGLVRVTTTLKSLASSVPVVLWLVAIPVERRMAWSPTSVTCPGKTFPGKASTETSTGCPMATFKISVSSTLTSAVMTDRSANVMSVLPWAF